MVRGVDGQWREVARNFNNMAANFTATVRSIAEVVHAVTIGDLSKKITFDVRGELLELKNTVNIMVDCLNGVVSEVIRVSVETGEGKLGLQVSVPGAGGFWKYVVDDINLMAANFTSMLCFFVCLLMFFQC